MPYLTDNPFQSIQQLVPGQPAYLFGTYNFDIAPARFLITNSALTSNVATITGQLIEGPIPTVNSLISVIQTQAGSGTMNVNRATITAVSISATTGIGTISYTDTNSNVTSVADTGMALIDTPEVPDALVNGYSILLALQAQPAEQRLNRQLMVTVEFPSLPTTATVLLYAGMTPYKTQMTTTGLTVATVTGGAQSTNINTQIAAGVWNYLCLVASSVTGGTNPTIIGKILG
jgi:hypothetical protein